MSMFLGYCLQKGDVDWHYLTSSLVLSVWKWKEITVEAHATLGVKFKQSRIIPH
jgi:phenylacetate-coenzyme A ligase PaaK-like adenylate-forming protein